MSWKLRGCPHCGGDILLYEDVNKTWVENCLQCGYNAVLKKAGWQLRVIKPTTPENRTTNPVLI
jgi:predicted  nucleic acid-binding Zn-ribbon protein